jgi:hypothetical protein
MEGRIEQLDRARRRTLLGFLVAFVAWQVPTIAQEALGTAVSSRVEGGLTILAAAAGGVWLVYAIRLMLLRREVARDSEAAAALDDERVRHLRAKSFTFAFWSLVVYLAAIRLATFATEIPAGAAALGGLLVAAAAVIAAFLVFDRE